MMRILEAMRKRSVGSPWWFALLAWVLVVSLCRCQKGVEQEAPITSEQEAPVTGEQEAPEILKGQVLVDLPEGSLMKEIAKDVSYRISWPDEEHGTVKALVTILYPNGLEGISEDELIEDYKEMFVTDGVDAEYLGKSSFGDGATKYEFLTQLDDRTESRATTILIVGKKVVEFILLHPERDVPYESQVKLVESLKGV